MSYFHNPFPYGSNVAIPVEDTMPYGVSPRHHHMQGPMDTYLVPHSSIEFSDFYPPPGSYEDYEEYAENLTRPRLTKEQVDTLEAQFQAHPKPNSNVKRQLAAQTNLTLPRVANWFQNRRAKAKQQRRQAEYERMQASEKAEKSKSDEASQVEDSSKGQSKKSDSASTPTKETTSSAASAPSEIERNTPKIDEKEKPANSNLALVVEPVKEGVNNRTTTRGKAKQPKAVSVSERRQSMDGSESSCHVVPDMVGGRSLAPGFREWEGSPSASASWTSSHSPGNGFEYEGLNQDSHHLALSDPGIGFSHSEADAPGVEVVGHGYHDIQYHGQADAWEAQSDVSRSTIHGQCQPFQPVPFSSLCAPIFTDQRRESCSSEHSELVDSMACAGLNPVVGHSPQHNTQIVEIPHQVETATVWRQLEKEVDIAARRKRPRPAAIGTSGLSRSFVGPSSMSPTARFSNLSPGHVLRHAKSTQNLSPRYSGIRKISAAQRSPLNISSFAEATIYSASNADGNIMAVPPLVTTTMAPPTPLTPEDFQHLMPPTPNDAQYCLSPTDDMGCTRIFPTSQPMQFHFESPPTTPLNMDVLSQLRYQAMTALSAPPQYTTFQDYSIPVPSPSMAPGPWRNMTALSSPEHASMAQTLHMPQPTHISPITYDDSFEHGDTSNTGGFVGQSPSPQFTIKVSNSPPPHSENSTSGQQKVTEFLIQEFPKQQEAHRQAAQLLAPQKPKTYTFTNQTPNDF
ncbi:hypothetical protein AJ80_06027 [Polytolypa hystricis UAMH7299]|uniref:Homeobox domain-containing protein n=1 Tax=Polytolypa hystricis (strain UAMH7299) TaxID=1447883 RepID=A0A2B7Y019_POLH7|nr:hypothetical protein AJ80_06027 [Polytolypa hystricis UAMH7299]